MPNVGFGEIFILLVVVLLVVGPAKLPEIARNLGKAYRTFQLEMTKAQETFRVSFDDTPGTPPPKPGGGVIDVPDPSSSAALPATGVVAAAAAPAPAPAPEATMPFVDAFAPADEPPEPEAPQPDVGIERNYEDT